MKKFVFLSWWLRNDLKWSQKIKSCLHFNYWIIFPAIRNLSSLNDLNSLNKLSSLNGLNNLISSKHLLSMMYVAINLATKWPKLVSQCGMDYQKSTILWIFGTLSGLRLWRTGMLFSTKSKCHKSNVRTSWMYRYSFYDFKVHLLWPNKFLVWLRSSLNTL